MAVNFTLSIFMAIRWSELIFGLRSDTERQSIQLLPDVADKYRKKKYMYFQGRLLPTQPSQEASCYLIRYQYRIDPCLSILVESCFCTFWRVAYF